MPIAKKNIPQDFLEQMKTNLTINTDEINEQKESNSSVISNSAETKPIISPASVQQKESSKKGKYADVMNVRLSNGRRDEIKRSNAVRLFKGKGKCRGVICGSRQVRKLCSP